MTEITIPLRSHDEAILVLGPYDRYAKLLRQDLNIEITTRRGNLRIAGEDESVQEARRRIEHLLGKARKGRELPTQEIEEILLGLEHKPAPPTPAARPAPSRAPATPYRALRPGQSSRPPAAEERQRENHDGASPASTRIDPSAPPPRIARMPIVTPRTENQRRYVELIDKHPLVFGVGPAGTGKTYLAVVMAIQALRAGRCKRLVITRPVVEAGERLGFLPGDVQAKLNPYMRPIYDALFDLLDFEEVQRLEETGVIEVAPLAFMRGRTLAHSFAILDEGQNTSISQMKMFLTRLGEGSRMVVTGDPTQNDLEGNVRSGLNDALHRFRGFDSIGVLEFGVQDIVRHPLVERIVRAYEAPARERGPEPQERGERPERLDRAEPPEGTDRPPGGDRRDRPNRGGRR